jgi:hypothetical protein
VLIAGGDALLFELLGGLHGDEPRFAVGECLSCGFEHGRAGAAAPDPSLRNRSIRQDDRFGARLRGRRGDGADHRCEREWLALVPDRADLVEDIGVH